VHKTNVLTFAGDLWERTFNEVATEFPDVATAYNHVDAACIYFVESPQRYDVIVTDNLFGDILTDLGGAVSGGIGFASSGNLNPDRTGPSMFEPVHGSAPDIAGQGVADPTAAILSASLLLDHLGHASAAAAVEAAVLADRAALAASGPGHPGVPRSTSAVGDAIAGGIGRAASANLNPDRTGPSMFEPVHGSAPDIAGTGTADPRAAIISGAMLLEFLGEDDAARQVRVAVSESDEATGSTSEVGDAIARLVEA
jgi:isocitrate/isopropylmalate dehydrogenase